MKKRNRFVAIALLLIMVLTTIIGTSLSVNAAVTKTGTEVTGQEVLDKLEEHKCTAEAFENDEQPDMAIVVQTRDFANIRKNGYKAVNYGLLLNYDGNKDSETKPLLVNKKRPQRGSFKYINETIPNVYLVTFTNTYQPNYSLFQKDEEHDAYEEGNVFYGYLYADEIEDSTSVNMNGVLDSKNNAQYIDPEAKFRMYTIKDPDEDKEIGLFFVEVSLAEKKQSQIANKNSSTVFVGDSRTVCMFSASGEDRISGVDKDGITVYAGWGLGYDFMKESVESAGEFDTLAVWLGCNDAAQGKSFTDDYAPYYESLLAQGKKIILFNVGRTEDKYLVAGDEGYKNANMVAYNKTMESWAKGREGVTYVDMYAKSSAWSLNVSDGIHYTPRPTSSIWDICRSFIK